jgi:Uma2 family endonuclease
MLEYNPLHCLPSAEDLPDSDDTPVDNELQDYIPHLLKTILAWIWNSRNDWFFGIDMGIYYDPDIPAIVPDGFLSLGVQRVIDEDLRLSYLLWEELVAPILTIEVVSQKRRGEYSTKKQLYEEIGILYYVVYNPLRKRKARLEVYRLVQGKYVLQLGNRIWLPEIGLAIGYERGTFQGITREWLYWYNQDGVRYKTPEELATDAEQRANNAELRAQKLAEQLRKLGINPDDIS